ncbi:MAG: electron transfer flavoprotein subunit alpha/FixB family protein, partial [Bacteroidales bacterium]|nr:electron transfer flavoprotein subunit alpha/FixB family protein [Bacteroidales bacterium]
MSIFVYTENWDGKFKKLTLELISYAKAMAEQADCPVVALSIGKVDDTELQRLSDYGADKIIAVEHDQLQKGIDNKLYSNVITTVATKEQARVILFSNNNSGKALAPRVSARMKAGLVSGAVALPVSIDPLVVRKAVFNGKAFAEMKVVTPVKVLTLAQNAFGLNEVSGKGVVEKVLPEVGEPTTFVVARDKVTGKILLNDAEIVVSGGRGMKGAEFWGPIETLASLLGAATACSRPVSDEGWRPHEEHTGQTGKIIAPNLYIA